MVNHTFLNLRLPLLLLRWPSSTLLVLGRWKAQILFRLLLRLWPNTRCLSRFLHGPKLLVLSEDLPEGSLKAKIPPFLPARLSLEFQNFLYPITLYPTRACWPQPQRTVKNLLGMLLLSLWGHWHWDPRGLVALVGRLL